MFWILLSIYSLGPNAVVLLDEVEKVNLIHKLFSILVQGGKN
jgi:hypothetical protein